MDFFHSIPLSFHIWPVFCMQIPRFFALKKSCVNVLVVLFIFVLLLHALTLKTAANLIELFDRYLIFYLPLLIIIVILVESSLKAKALEEFALQTTCIDKIMQRSLNIDTKHDVEKRDKHWRFLRWSLISMLLVANLFNWLYQRRATDASKFLFIYEFFVGINLVLGPLIIVIQLHFYRVVTFVDTVRRRYHLINDCITSLHSVDEGEFLERADEIRDFLNSSQSFEKLLIIRRVCRLLYSASHSINDLFGWSLFLCIFLNFLCLTVFVYAMLCNNFDGNFYMLMSLLIPQLNNMISLATVCEFTKFEVIFVSKLQF